MKCYNYYLYLGDDSLIDQTQIDEDNDEFALDLFLNEFGWGSKLSIDEIRQLYITKEEIEENED